MANLDNPRVGQGLVLMALTVGPASVHRVVATVLGCERLKVLEMVLTRTTAWSTAAQENWRAIDGRKDECEEITLGAYWSLNNRS